MALTLHVDASDTDKLYTDANGGGSGVHQTAPSDGGAVQAWDDEGGGMANVCLGDDLGGTNYPVWRSGTPLLLQPCLDFDGADDYMRVREQDLGAAKTLADLITSTAWTIMIAFHGESITGTSSPAEINAAIFSDSSNYLGLHVWNDGGQRKLVAYAWDTAAKRISLNISEGTNYVVTFRLDGGNLYAGLNNDAESGPTAFGTLGALTGAVDFGRYAGGTYFNGRIGEAKIWNDGTANSNLAAEKAAFVTKWVTGGGGGSTQSLMQISG